MSGLKEEGKKLEELYDKIVENRVKFIKECFHNVDFTDLKNWNVFCYKELNYSSNYYFSKDFISYIIDKEGLKDKIIETEIIIKKRFGKVKKHIKKEKEKHIFKQRMKKFRNFHKDISYKYDPLDDSFYFINSIDYKNWQDVKDILLLVKKHLRDFVIINQKKKICNLTNCYNDKIEDRICELCGSTVTGEAIYCSKCGGKMK